MTLFLGLDVGTQSTKGLVIDAEAPAIAARATSAYGLIEGLPPGHAEQHPDTWLAAVRDVLRQLAQQVDLGQVAGAGVSGQQHGFVPLDGDHQVIRPAKLWCDTATAAEARELSESFGRAVPAGFTASKILWLKRQEPASWARLRHVALPHDWINLQLTGRLTMEAGDASGTGFFDPERRAFAAELVRRVDPGLEAMLPPLVAAGESCGAVSEAASHDLGLPAGIPVATGGGDNMMSAIGSGATRPGVVVLSLGTSGTVFGYSARPVVDPAGLIAPFCDSTGGWLPLVCVMNLTGLLEEVREATGLDHAELTRRAALLPAGNDGLLLLPFLQGERVPDLPEATGTLFGLRPGWLQPGRLYRAVLEGATLNLAWGADRLRRLGVRCESLRLVGGGARNTLWRQTIADVLGVRVRAMRETESAALGAALQALWTAARQRGDATSLDTLSEPFLAFDGDEVLPDPSAAPVWSARRGEYARRLAQVHGVR